MTASQNTCNQSYSHSHIKSWQTSLLDKFISNKQKDSIHG
jgi:hypothetical protein